MKVSLWVWSLTFLQDIFVKSEMRLSSKQLHSLFEHQVHGLDHNMAFWNHNSIWVWGYHNVVIRCIYGPHNSLQVGYSFWTRGESSMHSWVCWNKWQKKLDTKSPVYSSLWKSVSWDVISSEIISQLTDFHLKSYYEGQRILNIFFIETKWNFN